MISWHRPALVAARRLSHTMPIAPRVAAAARAASWAPWAAAVRAWGTYTTAAAAAVAPSSRRRWLSSHYSITAAPTAVAAASSGVEWLRGRGFLLLEGTDTLSFLQVRRAHTWECLPPALRGPSQWNWLRTCVYVLMAVCTKLRVTGADHQRHTPAGPRGTLLPVHQHASSKGCARLLLLLLPAVAAAAVTRAATAAAAGAPVTTGAMAV